MVSWCIEHCFVFVVVVFSFETHTPSVRFVHVTSLTHCREWDFKWNSLLCYILVKAGFILKRKEFFFFSLLSCMLIYVFEVMSIYPIDWYQSAITRAIPLHELKKVQLNFKSVPCLWHKILFVWKCCAWAFYRWAVVWSLNRNAAAQR